MANNRMSLRCTVCDERYLLAKYYPQTTDGWFVPMGAGLDPAAAWVDSFGQFLERHSYCNEAGSVTLFGNTRFDLVFEVPERFVAEGAQGGDDA